MIRSPGDFLRHGRAEALKVASQYDQIRAESVIKSEAATKRRDLFIIEADGYAAAIRLIEGADAPVDVPVQTEAELFLASVDQS